MGLKKKYLLILGLMIIVVILGINFLPKRIDISYPAVIFNEVDGALITETQVSAKGYLYQPFWGEHAFRGKLMVEHYDFTSIDQMMDISYHKDFYNGMGVLDYSFIDSNARTKSEPLGQIWLAKNMNAIRINVIEEFNYDKDYLPVIIAPATTIEEAMLMSEELGF
ncbi:MAG: hypothetical protein ACRCST_05535 [Turicibacter sp.]